MESGEPRIHEIPEDTFPEDVTTRRVPCVLLLDTSASMRVQPRRPAGSETSGEESGPTKLPIEELNESLGLFKDALMGGDNTQARDAVDLTVITFGGPPQVVIQWQRIDAAQFPELSASGNTPLGSTILMALDMIEKRRKSYRQQGIPSYKPWMFILTDGEPDKDDDLKKATELVRAQQGIGGDAASQRLIVFAICTDNSARALGQLKAITARTFYLREVAYRELFYWIADSMRSVSVSTPGVKTSLPEFPTQMTMADVREIIP